MTDPIDQLTASLAAMAVRLSALEVQRAQDVDAALKLHDDFLALVEIVDSAMKTFVRMSALPPESTMADFQKVLDTLRSIATRAQTLYAKGTEE